MPITYGSVCSGIEAATCAWHPLGWQAEWFAEIEPFPSAVLAHHYPNTPNLGDMTKLAAQVLAGRISAPDILVGGTPCQAFSVAGMREGLADPRGALTIKYVELADATDLIRTRRGEPEAVIVWENVPGVLSDKGNAFGCFLGALAGEDCELQPAGKRWADAGCVYGPKRAIAWRVLDAQYFGLAQRRRRVFVVASARAGFDPAAVLFEREGVRRDTAPRRGEGENPTSTIAGGARKHGGYSTDDIPLVAKTLTANGGKADREDSMNLIAGTLLAGGKAAGSATLQDAESNLLIAFGGGANCLQTDVATALSAHPGGMRMDAETETFVVHGTQDPCTSDKAFALGRNSGQENAVLAFSCKDYGGDASNDLAPTLRAMGHGDSHANAGGQVAVCVTGDITHTLKADGFDGFDGGEDGPGRGQPIVAATLEATAGRSRGAGTPIGMLTANHSAVRRLTPTECERLQGFSDNYTLIPWRNKPAEECPDGPRYKAIGNSKAVPVVRWIGRRIAQQL